jgi:periplasmic protein TonB
VRLDSPFVLAFAGTIAIHTIAVVAADAIVVINPYQPAPPTPRIDLVDIQVPPVVKPPPPPVKQIEPPPVKQETVRPKVRAAQEVRTAQPPPPPDQPPPPPLPDTTSGGGPEIAMPDIAPSATGIAVAPGPRNTGRIGRGGSGGGTGSGAGVGSGSEPPPVPVSVATIKTRALPKGDYGYFDAGKDYPAEARQLGIEGVIRVRLIVDDKGKVKAAVLLNKLGHGLDELAMSRARDIEFEPAKDTDDRTVSSVVIWTFNMTLPK